MTPADLQQLSDSLATAMTTGIALGAMIGVGAYVFTEKFLDFCTLRVPRWIRAWRRARS